jgi:hypothetical protein
MYSEDQYLNALFASLRVRPQKFDRRFFKSYDTILKYYNFLRYSSFDEKFIVNFLNIIQPCIDNRKRFQRKKMIKLLKVHLKKRPISKKLKLETTNLLFKFYESQILNSTDETSNDLSVIIKNLELNRENIKWLIQNAGKSNYILNRLLRYPVKSDMISDWAKNCLECNQFADRKSELLGYVLDKYPDYEFSKIEKNKVAWGIYYSRFDDTVKEAKLKSILSEKTADSIIEISERLKFNNILESIWKNNTTANK